MKRKIKSAIALAGALVLAFSMNVFVFAADDIILDGDAGASSFIGKYSAESASGYKYLGFVTSKEATSAYKYMQITYKGDITYLRMEFNREDDSNEGPFWFNKEGQTLFFKTVDGSDIPLKVDKPTTITLDLSAIGIDMGEFRGMHLHYLDPNMTKDSFEIIDAKFMTSAPGAGKGKDTPDAPAENVENNSSGSKSEGAGSKSQTVAKGTEGTAGGSTDAPSTGSVMYPIVIAIGGIAVACVAFVASKKFKEEQ